MIDLGSDVCPLPGLIDAHVHLAFDASSDVVAGLDTVDDGRLLAQMAQAAHRALRAGITTVKVMVSGGVITPGSAVHESQYDLADLRLIVAEAHDLGLRAAAHVHGPGAVADAVTAGFDTPRTRHVLHPGRCGGRPHDHGRHRRVGGRGEHHGRSPTSPNSG